MEHTVYIIFVQGFICSVSRDRLSSESLFFVSVFGWVTRLLWGSITFSRKWQNNGNKNEQKLNGL